MLALRDEAAAGIRYDACCTSFAFRLAPTMTLDFIHIVSETQLPIAEADLLLAN